MTSFEASQPLDIVMELNPEGDGGAYRMKNLDGEINRGTIVQRGDSLTVQANLVDVIHGTHNGSPATLIVTDFWFMPGKKARRFTWAMITFKFNSLDPSEGGAGGLGPTVAEIAPRGHFSLHPTKKKVEKSQEAELSIEAPLGPVTPGASISWGLAESYDEEKETTLSGISKLDGRDFGGKNTARWTLRENSMTDSGIPTRLRTAIVLNRKAAEEEAKFQGMVEIKVDADVVSEMGFVIKRLLGKVPKDDPVIFDPKVSTSSVGFQTDNLEKHDLKDFCRVETTTWLRGDGSMATVDRSGGNKAEVESGKAESSGLGNTR